MFYNTNTGQEQSLEVLKRSQQFKHIAGLNEVILRNHDIYKVTTVVSPQSPLVGDINGTATFSVDEETKAVTKTLPSMTQEALAQQEFDSRKLELVPLYNDLKETFEAILTDITTLATKYQVSIDILSETFQSVEDKLRPHVTQEEIDHLQNIYMNVYVGYHHDGSAKVAQSNIPYFLTIRQEQQ